MCSKPTLTYLVIQAETQLLFLCPSLLQDGPLKPIEKQKRSKISTNYNNVVVTLRVNKVIKLETSVGNVCCFVTNNQVTRYLSPMSLS